MILSEAKTSGGIVLISTPEQLGPVFYISLTLYKKPGIIKPIERSNNNIQLPVDVYSFSACVDPYDIIQFQRYRGRPNDFLFKDTNFIQTSHTHMWCLTIGIMKLILDF